MVKSSSVGNASTPMAFDIAALQYIYGANISHNTGNNTYYLPSVIEAGTSWESIWDAGGEDTMSAVGASDWALIQLEDAKLTGPFAGGLISNVNNVVGGFTIANGVVIENAIGSSFGDYIEGNAFGNKPVKGAISEAAAPISSLAVRAIHFYSAKMTSFIRRFS